MKDNQLRQAGPPDTFDNTMLSNYLTCRRSLYFFLRRIDYDSIPPFFTFGRAFGQGINEWHSNEGKLGIEEREFLALEEAQRIWNLESPQERKNDTLTNLVSMVKLYCSLYDQEEQWKMLGAELGFRFPIEGTPYFYAGSLDAYIDWPGYGILAREDKTTGAYITDTYVNQWSHASQITGYAWGLKQVLGEMPFGVLMNFASKRPRKDNELRFSRNLETRSEWKMESFMKETALLIDEIRREWESWSWVKIGERNPMTCVGGMGKSPCKYRPICLLEAEPWELDEDYNFSIHGLVEGNSPWEPWEREGGDD